MLCLIRSISAGLELNGEVQLSNKVMTVTKLSLNDLQPRLKINHQDIGQDELKSQTIRQFVTEYGEKQNYRCEYYLL